MQLVFFIGIAILLYLVGIAIYLKLKVKGNAAVKLAEPNPVAEATENDIAIEYSPSLSDERREEYINSMIQAFRNVQMIDRAKQEKNRLTNVVIEKTSEAPSVLSNVAAAAAKIALANSDSNDDTSDDQSVAVFIDEEKHDEDSDISGEWATDEELPY